MLTFDSLAKFMEYLDEQIARLRSKVEVLEKRYTVLRGRAERIRMLENVLSKLIGTSISSISEVDYMGIKVVVSARSVDELAVVEETLAALRDTLTALTRVREVVSRFRETLGEAAGIQVLVQTLNGIPIRLLFKESEVS